MSSKVSELRSDLPQAVCMYVVNFNVCITFNDD